MMLDDDQALDSNVAHAIADMALGEPHRSPLCPRDLASIFKLSALAPSSKSTDLSKNISIVDEMIARTKEELDEELSKNASYVQSFTRQKTKQKKCCIFRSLATWMRPSPRRRL